MDELDGVDVASYPTVGTALCGLLEWLTAPAYAAISPSHHLLNTPTTTKPTSPLTKPKLDAPNVGEGEEAALKQATTRVEKSRDFEREKAERRPGPAVLRACLRKV